MSDTTEPTPLADETLAKMAAMPTPRETGEGMTATDEGTPGEAEITETAEEYAQSLAELLAANGYGTEDVTDTIFNVRDTDGEYLYTLTISRTFGY